MFVCQACLRRASKNAAGLGFSGTLPVLGNIPRASPSERPDRPDRSSRAYAAVAARAPPPVLGSATEFAVRKELKYLTDPLHISHRVRRALEKDDLDLASSMTRVASKDKSVVVSWNHLIDYQLRQRRIHAALKLYNEMKKRGQQPNAQTYTIIFRGCAHSEHPKLALNEAYKLYQNMLSHGRIKPNVIHLNAVLNVCARVGDIDSMFTILNSSDDPSRKPNHQTYTTILNAIRTKADVEPAGEPAGGRLGEHEIQKEKEIAIQRAKTIWQEVISRWRAGSVAIDEELVCAMGRILLMGGYKDADAIESLIEQTMLIPRTENKGLPGQEKAVSSAPVPIKPVEASSGLPASTYPQPGNNSLSLLLEAVEKTGRTTQAVKYWNIFTLHHHVVPDANNWTQILRVFHRGKNSGRAATMIQSMPSDKLLAKHIRLAMNICLRDNLNKAVVDNATAILKTMERNPSLSDVRSLRVYLQVAHASKRAFESSPGEDPDRATELWAQTMAAAISHVFAPYQSAAKKSALSPPDAVDRNALGSVLNTKAEVVALARKLNVACDIIISNHAAVLTQAQLALMKTRHASLTKFVNNYIQTEKPHLEEQMRMREEAYEEAHEDTVEPPEVHRATRTRRSKPEQRTPESTYRMLDVEGEHRREWRFERKFNQKSTMR